VCTQVLEPVQHLIIYSGDYFVREMVFRSQIGDGMANLTEEQQEFWDILRYPHNKHCQNCKHMAPSTLGQPMGSWRCTIIDAGRRDAEKCNPISWNLCPPYHLKWEWDGKTQ